MPSLNKIAASVSLLWLVLTSCVPFGKAVDQAQAACVVGLMSAPAIKVEAEKRKMPISELVNLFCAAVDVAAAFKQGPRGSAEGETGTDRALKLLHEKGEL